MFSERIQSNFPLADLSTYKIGGSAEYFVAVREKSDVENAWTWAKENNLKVTVLGGGSNILINDDGVKGLVIKLDNQELEVLGDLITCGTGIEVKTVSELALEHSLSGIEWSIGIPGLMGGAIRGNAGAHGISFDTVVQSVLSFDTEKFVWNELKPEDCGFTYRHSIFKENPRFIVWQTTLQLKSGDKQKMSAEMAEYKNYRLTSQPKEPSAGCIFKNLFAADVEKVNTEIVKTAEKEHKVRGGKIGAGYLIQKLGMMGLTVGGARISEKHANFIVNADHATAAEVRVVIEKIKLNVFREYGVALEEEVQYLGF